MATAKISAQRTLMVKAITIEPRTINGLRRRKTESHVYSVLYLIDIVCKTGDQRVSAKGVQLRIGKLLDMVKYSLTHFCGKAYAGFCSKKLCSNADCKVLQQPSVSG